MQELGIGFIKVLHVSPNQPNLLFFNLFKLVSHKSSSPDLPLKLLNSLISFIKLHLPLLNLISLDLVEILPIQ